MSERKAPPPPCVKCKWHHLNWFTGLRYCRWKYRTNPVTGEKEYELCSDLRTKTLPYHGGCDGFAAK